MKKVLISFVLALLPVLESGASVKIGSLYYNLDTNKKTAEVASYQEDKYEGDITIPAEISYQGTTYRVTAVAESAFWDCGGLTSIVLPAGLESIGPSAFLACTKLTSLKIPASVINIGDLAFCFEGALTSIVVDERNPVYDSRNRCNALIKTATNTLITGCVNTIIPGTVTSLADNAFEGCVLLKQITIPSSVKRIGRAAFSTCVKLESISIPNGVEQIGGHAFDYCQSLKQLQIPEGVKVIEEYLCLYCESLESVTIPSTATTVEDNPFPAEVKDIYCYATVPPKSKWGYTITIQPYTEDNGKFFFPATLHVPAASVEAYKNCDDGWQEFRSIVPLTSKEVGIQDSKFERGSNLSAQWYSIDGQAVTGRPTSNGIFIRKGADGTVKKYYLKQN